MALCKLIGKYNCISVTEKSLYITRVVCIVYTIVRVTLEMPANWLVYELFITLLIYIQGKGEINEKNKFRINILLRLSLPSYHFQVVS